MGPTHYYVLRQDEAVLLIREQEDGWRVRKSTLERIAYLERSLPGAVFHTIAYRPPKAVGFEPPEPVPREKSWSAPGRGDNRPYKVIYDGPPVPLMPEELLARYRPLTSMQLIEFQRHQDRIGSQLEQGVLSAVERVELPVLELQAEDVVIARGRPHLHDRDLADHLAPEGR